MLCVLTKVTIYVPGNMAIAIDIIWEFYYHYQHTINVDINNFWVVMMEVTEVKMGK